MLKFHVTLLLLQVHIYGPFSQEPVKTFTRFKDTAYSGRFRSDGQLLVAGCEDSVVRLFDVGGKVALRMFKGHTKYVSHWKTGKWGRKYFPHVAFLLRQLLDDEPLSDPSTESRDDLKDSDNMYMIIAFETFCCYRGLM